LIAKQTALGAKWIKRARSRRLLFCQRYAMVFESRSRRLYERNCRWLFKIVNVSGLDYKIARIIRIFRKGSIQRNHVTPFVVRFVINSVKTFVITLRWRCAGETTCWTRVLDATQYTNNYRDIEQLSGVTDVIRERWCNRINGKSKDLILAAIRLNEVIVNFCFVYRRVKMSKSTIFASATVIIRLRRVCPRSVTLLLGYNLKRLSVQIAVRRYIICYSVEKTKAFIRLLLS